MALYLLSLYGPEDWYDSTPDQWEADLKLHDEFAQAVAAVGVQIVASEALQPLSTAAVSDNRGDQPVVTDGPFIETKEALGGFYLIDARDREQALEMAAICRSGRVEVRPVFDMSPKRTE